MTDIENLVTRWDNARKEIKKWQAAEREFRMAIVNAKFPDADEGTHTVELVDGYKLKVNVRMNYNLDKDKVEVALDAIEKTGNEGTFIAERLVRFKPELSLSEYRNLAPQYRNLINEALTIKRAIPDLELVEP